MTGSCFSTKITEVSFWNIMEGPLTYGKDEMGLGFQNMLCIRGPCVACTFGTEHLYCFLIEDPVYLP